MGQQTTALVATLRSRLASARRRMLGARVLEGAAVFAGLAALVILAALALEALAWLPETGRVAVTSAVTAGLLAALAYLVALPLLRWAGVLPALSERDAAARVGAHFESVRDRLLNVLQLADGHASEAPDPLVDRAVLDLGQPMLGVPFADVEDFAEARRRAMWMAAPLAALALAFAIAPGPLGDAAQRLLQPSVAFARPAPFQLAVAPGSVTLVKGESIRIRATVSGGTPPETATVYVRYEGEDREEAFPLVLEETPEATGAASHEIVGVRRGFSYRVEAGPVESARYDVAVTALPFVRGLGVRLVYPAYTRLPAQTLPSGVGDVTGLPGTRAEITFGVMGEGVETADLVFESGREEALDVEGARASGAFTLRRDDAYTAHLGTANGLTNADPIRYTVRVLEDAVPSLTLTAPVPEAVLNETLATVLEARLSDDFGFSRLRLYVRLAESRYAEPDTDFRAIDLPLDSPRELDQRVVFAWKLRETGFDLVPGDVVEYYLSVWDNDTISGPKPARSAIQTLRLPSLEEQYDELSEEQNATEDAATQLMDEAERSREQFDELRRELQRKQEGDWEDTRQLEQLQQRQAEMQEQAESLSRQMESLTEQMRENELVSEPTLQLYEELQKVADEINAPELQEALQKLQEAMQQLDLQQMQQAMEEFEFSEEQYQERLERTLELFKRLQMQQGLEEAVRRAEELAEAQEELAEETREALEEQAENESGEQGEGLESESGEQGESSEGESGESESGENQDGSESESGESQGGEQSESGEQGEPSESESGEPDSGEQQEGQQNESDSGEQGESGESESSEGQPQEGKQSQSSPGGAQPDACAALAEEQARNRDALDALKERLEELQREMGELSRTPTDALRRVNSQAARLRQRMDENASMLRDCELQPAAQEQQEMGEQFQQMSQNLQQMQEQMTGQQKQVNMTALRRVLDDVLTLSEQQENLGGRVRGLASDSPQLRAFAQRQVEMAEDLAVVTDTLQALSREIPQMSRTVQEQAGESLREMGNATAAMADRSAATAAGHQKDAMMHLNELALLLSDLMDQLMGQQGSGQGGGMSMQQMMQQMQQMSGQQQQLNQQVQQMLNDAQGNRLSQDAQQRLGQMAAQQEAIRKQLRELARQPGMRGQGVGDLERIAREMEQTIQDLQRQQVSRQTTQRQQQILQRLLEAQRSMQQRGQENRREGQQGEDRPRDSPSALPEGTDADALRRALIRALESGYASDYQDLIKRYFDLLQERGATVPGE